MVTYYDSGVRITGVEAFKLFYVKGLMCGYDGADLEAIWATLLTSEEARDTIFEVSGYCLEIELY